VLLVREDEFSSKEIWRYYAEPIQQYSGNLEQWIALSLDVDPTGKVTAKTANKCLKDLEKILTALGNVEHLFITDPDYFRKLTGQNKVTFKYGLIFPTKLPGITANLGIPWSRLYSNPTLESILNETIHTATMRKFNQNWALNAATKDEELNHSDSPISATEALHRFCAAATPSQTELCVDIETTGLHWWQDSILSIALVSHHRNRLGIQWDDSREFKQALKKVLVEEFPTLVFHNAPFDVSFLVRALWMRDNEDYAGMLEGIHAMYRDTEDTRILAYLALNSTARPDLSLKALGREFLGDWGVESYAWSLKLLEYNIQDALATHLVYVKYREKVPENVWREVFQPSLKTLTLMQMVGLPFEQEPLQELQDTLEQTIDQARETILNSSIIEDFMETYREQLAEKANKKLKVLRKTGEDFKDVKFNPNSSKQLRELLFGFLKLQPHRTTPSGEASTDDETLKALINHLEKQYTST
jgi:DNA polymerase-1